MCQDCEGCKYLFKMVRLNEFPELKSIEGPVDLAVGFFDGVHLLSFWLHVLGSRRAINPLQALVAFISCYFGLFVMYLER